MKRGLVYFLGFLTLALPMFVLAQSIPGNTLVGDTGGLVPCSGTDCGTCQIVVLGNRVLRFIIMIMIVGVVLLAAWGGFNLLISGGNPSEYTRAKNMLKNVLIGLILMLVAWLIIDTGMKALLKNSGQVQMSAGQWLPWNQVSCSNQVPLSDGIAHLPGSSNWPRVTATGLNATQMTPQQLATAAGVAYNPNDPYATQLCSIASSQGLGAYCRILQAQMYQESGYNPNAISPAGAAGIFQIMPGTASQLCSQTGLCDLSGMSNSQIQSYLTSHPQINMQLGVTYFGQGLQASSGNVANALAYYNGGPRALNQSVTCPGQTWWQCTANSGYAETRNYVNNILGMAGQAPMP